jgi:hypothetical protein
VTVEDPKHKRLKIPLWMVAAEAAQFELADEPTIDAVALLRLVELCELHCDRLAASDGDPYEESKHEATLVDRAASGNGIDVGS